MYRWRPALRPFFLVLFEKQNGQFFYAFYHSQFELVEYTNRELQVSTDPAFCNYP